MSSPKKPYGTCSGCQAPDCGECKASLTGKTGYATRRSPSTSQRKTEALAENACGSCAECLRPACGTCIACNGGRRCEQRKCSLMAYESEPRSTKVAPEPRRRNRSVQPSSPAKDSSKKKLRTKSPKIVPELYGRPIPLPVPPDTCGGCLGERHEQLQEEPVLICDGCNVEWHLQCAQLTTVPSGDWLCPTCFRTEDILRNYLEAHDRDRADKSVSEYIQELLAADLKREGLDPVTHSPVSELALAHDVLAKLEMGFLDPDGALSFVGQNVQLFVHASDRYFVGRIVDKRPFHREPGVDEYLVRFPGGIEGRKETFYHWIILEEHSALVGSGFVWILHHNYYGPGQIMLRTSRELALFIKVPEDEIYIQYEGQATAAEEALRKSKRSGGNSIYRRRKVELAVFVKSLVSNAYVSVEKADLAPFVKQLEMWKLRKVDFVATCSGYAEQQAVESVRKWHQLPSEHPWHPTALTSLDYYQRLLPYRECGISFPVDLCPAVRRGFDKQHILRQLAPRCGIRPTKEAAAGIKCRIVPIDIAKYNAEVNKEEQQGYAVDQPHSD